MCYTSLQFFFQSNNNSKNACSPADFLINAFFPRLQLRPLISHSVLNALCEFPSCLFHSQRDHGCFCLPSVYSFLSWKSSLIFFLVTSFASVLCLLHMKEFNALASSSKTRTRHRSGPSQDLGLANQCFLLPPLLGRSQSLMVYVTQARLIRATWKKKPAPITVRI